MTKIPESPPDGDDENEESPNFDAWIEAGIRAADDRKRWYYRNRDGRFWLREYEKAGVA